LLTKIAYFWGYNCIKFDFGWGYAPNTAGGV